VILRFIIFNILIFTAILPTQAFEFDSDVLVRLDLKDGSSCIGRIVDADAHQLHLVGAKVNRLIPYITLTDATRSELKLPVEVSQNVSVTPEFLGLNAVRATMQKQEWFRQPIVLPTYYFPTRTLVHPIIPTWYRPCAVSPRLTFSSSIFLHF